MFKSLIEVNKRNPWVTITTFYVLISRYVFAPPVALRGSNLGESVRGPLSLFLYLSLTLIMVLAQYLSLSSMNLSHSHS